MKILARKMLVFSFVSIIIFSGIMAMTQPTIAPSSIDDHSTPDPIGQSMTGQGENANDVASVLSNGGNDDASPPEESPYLITELESDQLGGMSVKTELYEASNVKVKMGLRLEVNFKIEELNIALKSTEINGTWDEYQVIWRDDNILANNLDENDNYDDIIYFFVHGCREMEVKVMLTVTVIDDDGELSSAEISLQPIDFVDDPESGNSRTLLLIHGWEYGWKDNLAYIHFAEYITDATLNQIYGEVGGNIIPVNLYGLKHHLGFPVTYDSGISIYDINDPSNNHDLVGYVVEGVIKRGASISPSDPVQGHLAVQQNIDMIGYSMGGLVARAIIKYEYNEIIATVDTNGKNLQINNYICIGTPNHGTLPYVPSIDLQSAQMSPRSVFLNALNSGDETPHSDQVRYLACAGYYQVVVYDYVWVWLCLDPPFDWVCWWGLVSVPRLQNVYDDKLISTSSVHLSGAHNKNFLVPNSELPHADLPFNNDIRSYIDTWLRNYYPLQPEDTTPPTINYEYTGDGTDGNAGQMIFTATDEYGIDGPSTQIIDLDPSIIDVPQIHTVTFVDNNGLTSTRTESVTLVDDDTESPEITKIEYLDGDYTDGAPGKLRFTAVDDSGIMDGEQVVDELSIDVPVDPSIVGEVQYIEAPIFYDADNDREGDQMCTCGLDLEIPITLSDDDTIAPKIEFTYTGDHTDGNPGQLIVNSHDPSNPEPNGDEDSGLALNPSQIIDIPNSLGTHEYEFTATDNDDDREGDALTTTSSTSITIEDDDTEAPVINATYDTTIDNHAESLDVELSITDQSGIASVEVEYGGNIYVPDEVEEGSYSLSLPLIYLLGSQSFTVTATDADDDRFFNGENIDDLTAEETFDFYMEDAVIYDMELNLDNLEFDLECGQMEASYDLTLTPELNYRGQRYTDMTLGSKTMALYGTGTYYDGGSVWNEIGDERELQVSFEITYGIITDECIEDIDALIAYIDTNVDCECVKHSLIWKLEQAKTYLLEAEGLVEEGNILCGLLEEKLAKIMVRISEFKTALFDWLGCIDDEDGDYIIERLRCIRNEVVFLMGNAIGTADSLAIAGIENALFNLQDDIKDELSFLRGFLLKNRISSAIRDAESCLFRMSADIEYTKKLEHAIRSLTKAKKSVSCLEQRGKISLEISDNWIDRIDTQIAKMEELIT